MKKIIFLLSLFFTSILFAQKFTIKGTVKDQSNLVLEGATVYIQSIKDSIPIAYGITNKNGLFSIHVNTENDSKAIFNIAYLGYKPYKKDINIPTGNVLDMHVIKLEDQAESLNAVSIITRSPPVVIKKDTIEYNADSFKTLPNDKAEDLLKKLPGIEIDLDGNMTYNGIEVEAINVDGMRFFGEKKGEIALKNLPSNVVSKVQVTDFKTNMQKFTGEESDSGTKEINLKIKKGKNRGAFGDVKVGYGTDEKYQANANAFQVVDGKQFGVISGTNNINLSRGFNALPSTNTSTGSIESDFIGANYTKGKWNETRVNGNYKFSAQNQDRSQKSFRENFLPNLNFSTFSETSSFNDSDRHQGGADLKFIFQPKNKKSKRKVQLSNEIQFERSTNTSGSLEDRVSISSENDSISDYSASNYSEGISYGINNQFRATVITGKKRDYLNLILDTDFSKQILDAESFSENLIFNTNNTTIQNQETSTNNNDNNIRLITEWNKELFTNFVLIPKYYLAINYQKNENLFFDFNDITEDFDDFNEVLSSDNKFMATTLSPALKLRYQYKDFRFEVEGVYTNAYRDYTDKLIESRDFKADFEYFTYSARLRYRNKNGYKSFNLSYNQNVSLPSVNQLQPVEDFTDITRIIVGNPDLKPEFNHNLQFDYQNNIAFNNINIAANARAGFVQDKIINSTITDVDLNRLTTYDNTDGDYSLSGGLTFSKSYFSKNANININMRMGGSFRNSISVQNAIKFTAKTTTFRPSLSFKYSYSDKFDFSGTYTYTTNESDYDTNAFSGNDFFVQNLNFEASIFFLKNVFLTNKVAYTYNSSVGDEFDGDAVFWNAGLGLELWDNKATLTLIGYDMLGKNNGFRRTITETYIQDVDNRILEQYFMLNFTYKFGSFAGQRMNVRGRTNRGERGSSRGGR